MRQLALGAMIGFALIPGAAFAAAEADEAWIDRYVAQSIGRPAQAAPTRSQAALTFAELAGRIGQPVSVRLNDGRLRQGVVERVHGDTLVLSATISGGRFSYNLARGQIRAIDAE